MTLLPVVVPDIPEDRSLIVAARLARKIAPLMGVPWPGSPFDMTWVCDFPRLTLSEIGRGAPLPVRAEAPDADERDESGGRAVATGPRRADGKPERLPNELANATLHRFGPDAKAAVVLIGANRLLDPVTSAIGAAMSFVDSMLPVRLRLAAWAAMVLEAFRSQPALFVAAIQARSIQRAVLTRWELPLPRRLAGQQFARCEIGAPWSTRWRPGSAVSPVDLDISDRTIHTVQLGPQGLPSSYHELSERWLRRLAAMGTAFGDGYLWLSERAAGHRVVEAFIPQTPLVDAYLREVVSMLPEDDQDAQVPLPVIPDARAVGRLDRLARRALVLGLTTVVRQIRFNPEQREHTRTTVLNMVDALVTLASTNLGPDDPVTMITRCRAADIKVETLRQSLDNDLTEPLRDLMGQLDRCERAYRDGLLDRGLLAELVYSGNVELNVVMRNNATTPGSSLPSPSELNYRLQRSWATFLELVHITPDHLASEDGQVARQAGFHLSAYASYLAGQPDESSLRSAVMLFEQVVLPARQARYQRSGLFEPLRQSLQTASRATTTLCRQAETVGDLDLARKWATLGYEWITTAAADDHTRRLLGSPTQPACHFALLAAPALLAAVRVGVPGTGPSDVAQARELVDIAQRFADLVTQGGQYRYVRQHDIDMIVQMIADQESVRHTDI